MYTTPNTQLWTGRLDGDLPEERRFHQVIQLQANQSVSKNKSAFSIIGFASDEGVRRNQGRIGARKGPDAIRKQLAKLPYCLPEEAQLYDAGDVHCNNGLLEAAQRELGEKVHEQLSTHNIPIIFGGGHETFYGHYLGIRKFLGVEKKIGIINIDAHFDLRDDDIPSSGTMFRQVLERDANAGYLCLGIQRFGNTKALFDASAQFGCEYVLEENVRFSQISDVFKQIDSFAKKHDFIIFTLCMDAIDASAAPGVSAPSPLGMNPKLVKVLLKYIAANEKTISFDISEVNPEIDESEKNSKTGCISCSRNTGWIL
ncbi:formimidoylglutamase [Virgibacillus halophilus]|uniref:Formimidoylglutamase n=1 Tax=Tigheibacillus halophilus TaxID=361280 RepID=A0ABU5C454_9BACI|nr:formimidoylglutamase [Virgibacillus halophilus]